MQNELFIGKNMPEPEIWHNLLVKWRELMDAYIERYNIHEIREEQKDLPYWWEHEDANGGILAGAVWSLKGNVIKKYGVIRRSTESNSKGKCDLCIGLGPLKCAIEYKKIYLSTLSKKTIKQIKNELNEAKSQLQRIKESIGIRIAICFVVPWVNGKYHISAVSATKSIFDKIAEDFREDNNLIVTYIPRGNVKIEHGGYYYPGVALVGELIN